MAVAHERIAYIDLAKGFCILLVVVYHIMGYYVVESSVNTYGRMFRLPLYFFLSGVFFKTYGGFVDFLKRKTNKLLVPFAFWYLIGSVGMSMLLRYGFNRKLMGAKYFTLGPALTDFVMRDTFPNVAIWFLLCLFEVNILFYLIYKISNDCTKERTSVIVELSLLSGIIGLVLGGMHVNIPCFVDSALTALPFFSFGYLLNQNTDILRPNKYDRFNLIYVVSALGAVCAATYWFGPELNLRANEFNRSAALMLYPVGIIGTMAMVLLAKAIGHLPVVSYFGRYSIMILVTHIVLMQLWFYAIRPFHLPRMEAALLNIFLTLSSYFALIPLMRRLLPHVTAQKDLIKL